MRPKALESFRKLPPDLEHVWQGYWDLETERPWVAVPMGAPFQGPVPWSSRNRWLEVKHVPEEDHETYERLWSAIAEEMAQGK